MSARLLKGEEKMKHLGRIVLFTSFFLGTATSAIWMRSPVVMDCVTIDCGPQCQFESSRGSVTIRVSSQPALAGARPTPMALTAPVVTYSTQRLQPAPGAWLAGFSAR